MQSGHAHTSLKEKQRQERENLILQVAEDVFLEKGYYEASMDEIAVRVGIAKGTIYLHFPGKDELVSALITRSMRTFMENMEQFTAGATTAQGKLEALFHHLYTGIYSKHVRLFSYMYNEVDKQRILEKNTYTREFWDRLVQLVTNLLEEGKDNGEFDPSIPTSIMVCTFFSLFSPKSFNRLIIGETFSLETVVDYMRRIYFKGIAADKANETQV